ncbi:hypothetical protein [uncultured Halomonas sp.]|uniref:hypothetical protein n=1 Tax=uncultured Halomonas sp. TaxID=173971 RepID=UPI002607E916|nr:hypothetical protein [uncultured Halomonas sp.]
MSEVRVIQLRDVGPLHSALLRACPPNEGRVVSVGVLAGWLGVTTAAIYKWISEGQVPPARVPELIRLQREHFGEVRVHEGELNPIFG